MVKTIKTRLPDKYVEEWKKDYAVEMYKKGEFSFGQASKFAEISVWEFPNLLKEKKAPLNLDIGELESELETIKWKRK